MVESSRADDDAVQAGRKLARWTANRLLAWFTQNRRDLPWRRSRDPYRIWISEVMLQQTQVATVIPYFERFLTAFPTLTALAAADEQAVLHLWEGLGYYRRARDLHRAAQVLANDHAGQIPDDPEVLRNLPGLGRYTCNAVLSQAYDRRLPILEANSQRLLSRLFGRHGDPRRPPAQRWLWQAAEGLLPVRQTGAFNQALMELGSLVCTPTSPHCSECPLAARCQARRLGQQGNIPGRTPAPAVTRIREVALVIRQGEQVLLVQRPRQGRWAGLWEFPHGPVEEGEGADQAALRCALALTGLKVQVETELLTIRHGITRYQITLTCLVAGYQSGRFVSDFYIQGIWVKPEEELVAYPVSAPQRRLALALGEPMRQRRLF